MVVVVVLAAGVVEESLMKWIEPDKELRLTSLTSLLGQSEAATLGGSLFERADRDQQAHIQQLRMSAFDAGSDHLSHLAREVRHHDRIQRAIP